MTINEPTNMFNGELAALQRSQEMESLSTSPVSSVLGNIADVIGEFGVPGAGLFARALRSGQTPVEKVVEQLENGAYAEIARIWKHLEGLGVDARLKEFEARLRSQEAQSAYLGAVLHGLRTSDPRKHIRLGALTINCVYANNLEPESLDGMMQATVELREEDIVLLGSLYKWQNHILTEKGMNPNKWFQDIQQAHKQFVESGVLNQQDHLRFRSSYTRLESLGLIQEIPSINNHYGVGYELYALLLEGKKFYERIQDVGTK
jgi:hypothetical protein